MFTMTNIATVEYNLAVVVLLSNLLLCLVLVVSLLSVSRYAKNLESAYPRLWRPFISFFGCTGMANVSGLASDPILYLSCKILVLASLLWLCVVVIQVRERLILSCQILQKVSEIEDEEEASK